MRSNCPTSVVVGILRGSDPLSPHGATVFVPGDELLAVVRADQIDQLASVFRRT